MTHDELAHDLAEHLANERRMVWENLTMGRPPAPRPDVYVMEKSFTRPAPRTFEVKVSISDFRADVTAGKWMNYLEFSESVTFAVPHGLVGKADIPKGCGFMVRSERGWATIKRATRQPCELAKDVLLKLLMGRYQVLQSEVRAKDYRRFLLASGVRRDLGAEVADFLARRGEAEEKLALAQERAEKKLEATKAEADAIRKAADHSAANSLRAVCEALGAPEGMSTEGAGWAIRKRLKLLDRDEEVARLRAGLAAIKRAFNQYGVPLLDDKEAA